MTPIRIPLANQQKIPSGGTATGTPLEWDFRSIDTKLGDKHLHVMGVELDIQLNITGAASSSAIAVTDYPLFLTSFTMQRDPQRPIFPALPGWLMFAYNCATGLGYYRGGKLPTAIAANSTAAFNKYFRFLVPFDRPFSASSRFEYCPPLGAFISQGKVRVGIGIPTGSTGITFTDGNGTVDVNLLCVPLDDPRTPPDLRWEPVADSATGTKRGIVFPGGLYHGLIYSPYALGGQALGAVTLDGSSYSQSNLFRALAAIPSTSAIGGSYVEQYAALNLLDNADTNAINYIVQNKIVPLFLWGANADATKAAFLAPQDFKLDVTVASGSITNGHLFLVGRVYPEDIGEQKRIAAKHGVRRFRRHKDVAQFRPAGHEIKPGKRNLIGTKLMAVH